MSTLTQRALGCLALLALVALAIWRSHAGTALDTFTVDEPWHVVAGATYARSGDFSLNPEHPPLAKLWVGALMPDTLKLREPIALSEKSQERDWVEETMYYDNDPQLAQEHARIGMWSLHAVLLAALGLLMWRACGLAWALGTLAFLAIEPTVGAHLPVVMTDLPLALTLLIASVATGLLAAHWQWRWVLACGAAIGVALGAKHSAIPGIGALLLVLLVAAHFGWRNGGWREVLARHLKAIGVGVLAVVVLWAQYGFHFHANRDGSDAFNRPITEKIDELKLPHWRNGIALADRLEVLPRAYLWGLADTVRTGVEGRSLGMHFIWGTIHHGSPPWFSWPLVLLSKIPLALLGSVLLGALVLWRMPLAASARWTLGAVLAACTLHMVALVGSGGVWGGVRHALPVLAAGSVLAGAAVAFAWHRRSRASMAAVAALYVAAVAMTIREPRLWEYHNELVGGSANGHRYFENEGLDLGQRFGEIREYNASTMAATGLPVYSDYWMGEEQTRAGKINYRRRVENLNDSNVEGIYDGFFLYPMFMTLPRPELEWDPADVFKDMQLVTRFGNVGVWKGRQVRPRARAGSLYTIVEDYIYIEKGDNWGLVAQRLEEVAALEPQMVNTAVELGNAYVRLGEGDKAITAYRRVLEQKKMAVDALIRAQLIAQIERIESSSDVKTTALMRNPWLE